MGGGGGQGKFMKLATSAAAGKDLEIFLGIAGTPPYLPSGTLHLALGRKGGAGDLGT